MVHGTAAKNKTGVRNPFALAEKIHGKRISWKRLSYDSRVSKLEDAFDIAYGELFDPRHGKSPLFDLKESKSGSVVQGSGFKSVKRKEKATGGVAGQLGTYASPSSWSSVSNGTYTVTDRNVKDPIQGVIPDCWLIAALASIAFVPIDTSSICEDQPMADVLTSAPSTPYLFYFYDSNCVQCKQYTSDSLPLDSSGNLIYAHSSAATETWPAIYEKAYYQWRLGVTQPDYSQLGAQSAVTPLRDLTGVKPTEFLTSGKTAATVFSSIFPYTWADSTTMFGMSVPAIAYTYNPSVTKPPSGVTYSNSTIVAAHAYSLLGLVGTKSGSTWKNTYIILRNPFGPSGGDPGLTTSLYTTGKFANISLSDNDGVFALDVATFIKYFQGYALAI